MEVVCFLPGILGSELHTKEGLRVWPPTAAEAVTGLGDHKIAALLTEVPLVPIGAVERVCVKTIYRGLLDAIEAMGFTRTGTQQRLAVLAYDWRLDIVDEIAPAVAEALDALVEAGATRLHLVAHSMGGLVARMLLQDRRYATRAWHGRVAQLITIATPFKGAPLTLARLFGMEGVSGIPAAAFAKLRGKARLRAPYQLLPPPGTPMVWTIEGGTIRTLDLYGGFGAANGFLAESLASVGRMHAILNQPWPPQVAAFQFAGTGFETVTRLARHQGLRRVTDENSGDETVPLSSATGTAAPTMILPGEHLDIVNNRKLRRSLRALLGADDTLVIFAAEDVATAGEAQQLQLSLPVLGVVPVDGVVATEALVTLTHPLADDRVLTVEILELDRRTEVPVAGPPRHRRQVTLNKGGGDLTFRLTAELAPGLYQVTATLPGGVVGETALIVREAER